MVVSKFDALKIAESTGDLPQNVNFANRSEVMRLLPDLLPGNHSVSAEYSRPYLVPWLSLTLRWPSNAARVT